MVKIAVIGGGINGLASAVRIKEFYKDNEVVVISDKLSPDTTGDGSGGLWYPYLCGSTPEPLLLKWGSKTYKFYHELWLEGGYSLCLIPIYYFFKENAEVQRPAWANEVFGFRLFSKEQLEYYNVLYRNLFKSGITFSTFVVHPNAILKYFTERFKSANGKILRAKVASLRDPLLDDYDVVINCSGLGARTIVPDDTVHPIRGQISKVQAPWINEVIVDNDEGYYIIPNIETCVLGGTHQEQNYSTQLDDADNEYITKGCTKIIPGLKHAPVVNQWAGLRPGRHEVRLESEERSGKFFIHNYGHGGSGFTLFWGCAEEVLNILKEKLKANKKSKL